LKLLSGSNAKAPSPSLVLGASQPVAGRRRGGVRALGADLELARRHPLVEVVVEEDEWARPSWPSWPSWLFHLGHALRRQQISP
jgi:hypothetical protein